MRLICSSRIIQSSSCRLLPSFRPSSSSSRTFTRSVGPRRNSSRITAATTSPMSAAPVSTQGAPPSGAAPPAAALPQVFIDFDETLTSSDTTDLLGRLAVRAAHVREGTEGGSQAERHWAGVKDNFKAKFAAFSSASPLNTPPQGPPPPGQAFHRDWVWEYLRQAHEFDSSLAKAVSDSGVLKGISQAELEAAARAEVLVRPGSLQFLRACGQAGADLNIISVNFSRALIRAALGPAVNSKTHAVDTIGSDSFQVHANELEGLGDTGPGGQGSSSSGKIQLKSNSALDKLRVLESLLRPAAAGSTPAGPASIYIGDAASDLPCLLRCDLGIIVKSKEDGKALNGTLARLCEHGGIQLRPLSAYTPAAGPRDATQPPVLYHTASWDDVASLVLPMLRPGQPPALIPRHHAPRVLSVAGSDSGGGAGIQADLKTFEALGVFGMTAITAITAQNTRGVQSYEAVSDAILEAQLRSVLSDIGASAVKTGMLPSAAAVETLVRVLSPAPPAHLVVDPVMISTSGHALSGNDTATAIITKLLPLASVVTPNIPEARALLRCALQLGSGAASALQGSDADAARSLIDRASWGTGEMEAAAGLIRRLGPAAVLVKGGHLDGDQATDILVDASGLHTYSSPRVPTANSHGTGCTLASAIASYLARGWALPAAVGAAKAYITGALGDSARPPPLLIGSGSQRPFLHSSWAKQVEGEGAAAKDWVATVKSRPDYLRCYLVTDPGCNARSGRSMLDAVRQALDGGATIIQLREKNIEGGAFTSIARDVLALCRSRGVPMVINDRVDVALAVDADGVHVGQGDIDAALVRRMIGPEKILGVSCKNKAQAAKAAADGADYIGCGAVFPTTTKDSKVMGTDGLAEICQLSKVPVVAIGGINKGNAASCVRAGAVGVAVVSAVFAAQDAAAATREILDQVVGR